MNDYKKDLEIDFSNLEECWRTQASNYMKWSEKWANAVAERDRAKELVETIRAEVDAEIRAMYGKKKPTEAAISSKVDLDGRYKDAVQNYIEKTRIANLYYSTKSAFESRKKALEGLTQLWLGGYWSEPKIPYQIKEKVKSDPTKYQQEQKAKLAQNERLKKRKTK